MISLLRIVDQNTAPFKGEERPGRAFEASPVALLRMGKSLLPFRNLLEKYCIPGRPENRIKGVREVRRFPIPSKRQSAALFAKGYCL
jgi:hypothetical protein